MTKEELITFFNKQLILQQNACRPEIFNIPMDALITDFITLSNLQLGRVSAILHHLSILPSIPLSNIIHYQEDYQRQNKQLFDIFLTHASNPTLDLTWLTMPLNHLNIHNVYAMTVEEPSESAALMQAPNPDVATPEKASGPAVKESESQTSRFPRAAKNFPRVKLTEPALEDDHKEHQKHPTTEPRVKKAKIKSDKKKSYEPSTMAQQAAKNRKRRKQHYMDLLNHSDNLAIENQQLKTEIRSLLDKKRSLVTKIKVNLGFFSKDFDQAPLPEKLSRSGEDNAIMPPTFQSGHI